MRSGIASRRSVITRRRYSRKCSRSTPSARASVSTTSCDGSRPSDSQLVVVLLDDCRHDAARTDPVAPHHDRPLLPVLVEEHRAERLREPRPELEDVPNLERDLEPQGTAAVGTPVALAHLADVDEARLVVAPGLDAAQVPA